MGSVVVSTIIWARPDNGFVWLCLFTIVFTAGLGLVDDYLKVTKKKSDGIPGRIKLICQFILAAIVTAFFLLNPSLEVQAKELYIPFFKEPIIANLRLVHAFVLCDSDRGHLQRRELDRWPGWPRDRVHGDRRLDLRNPGLCGRERRYFNLPGSTFLSPEPGIDDSLYRSGGGGPWISMV